MSTSGPLYLTKKHVVSDEVGTLELRFRNNLNLTIDHEIALRTCVLPYSWFNITERFNNTTISYYWPTDASTNLVEFRDSFMDVRDISSYIQKVMLANNHYLVDENGLNVYYMEIQNNRSIYGNTLTVRPLPSALPDGWSNPGGLSLSAPNAKTPQLVFGTNEFNTLLGFNKSTSYPATPQSAVTLIHSPNYPEISPTGSVMLSCDLVNSTSWNTYGNILDTFDSGDTIYGGRITREPVNMSWLPVVPGSYSSIRLRFYDQDLVPLQINDKQIVIVLEVRKKPRA